VKGEGLAEKRQKLGDLFTEMRSVLVAFSGGIDSTLVLKVAHDRLGAGAIGVTAVSPTFPQIELETARRLGREIGARHIEVQTDQLEIADFVRNDAGRCYHCKTDLYSLLGKMRHELALGALVDGTNVDDLEDDRPGLIAAREWGVRSPLVEAGLSKTEVRELARHLGLSNWDKPAAACLSSRVPRGVPITREKLLRVEQAELVLLQDGFRQCRVRDHGEEARIEVDRAELPALLIPERRERVTARLKELGFRFVTVDREGYRRGGANKKVRGEG
jgi:uncharacterized protein